MLHAAPKLAEPHILCDVDGVLASFVGGLIRSHGWDIPHGGYASWNYHRELGMTDEEMWRPTREPGWWENLEPYPGAQEFVSGLRKLGHVIFCTSPGLHHACASEKIVWLRKHGFMDEFKNDYQMGPKKELNAASGAVLIDDSNLNVGKYTEAGGYAILYPQPWNDLKNLAEHPDRNKVILRVLKHWSDKYQSA